MNNEFLTALNDRLNKGIVVEINPVKLEEIGLTTCNELKALDPTPENLEAFLRKATLLTGIFLLADMHESVDLATNLIISRLLQIRDKNTPDDKEDDLLYLTLKAIEASHKPISDLEKLIDAHIPLLVAYNIIDSNHISPLGCENIIGWTIDRLKESHPEVFEGYEE
jgi:hypothetical protein